MIIQKNFILETFLILTSETYPYGTEDDVMQKMIYLDLVPNYINKDQHGNYFLQIGESRTIFASHLDTVSKDKVQVNHQIKNNIISSDGKTILGADDKAGVTVMLWMIKNNVPGTYYFFVGEEVGCVGSGLASKYGDFKGKFDRIISFDRRGTDSVITYQSSSRCCSDEFAKQLAKELNKKGLSYKIDDTGVYTDSAEFTSLIPECTNLSVGYYKEHTTTEHQDIKHLEKLAQACLLVDWEALVTKRDMSKTEYKSYYTNYSEYDWRSRDYAYYDREDYGSRTRKRKKKNNRFSYHDDWYDQSWDKYNAGKSYFDGSDGLVELEKTKSKSFNELSYDWILEKFTGREITALELEIIREQYLDFSNESDKAFYQYLVEITYEKNQ